jgi:hypothetical protein
LEIVGDQQRGKSGRRSAQAGYTVPVNAFKEKTEYYDPPPDKNRRAVEVGHRRTPLQVHPDKEAGGMNHESCYQNNDGGSMIKKKIRLGVGLTRREPTSLEKLGTREARN